MCTMVRTHDNCVSKLQNARKPNLECVDSVTTVCINVTFKEVESL